MTLRCALITLATFSSLVVAVHAQPREGDQVDEDPQERALVFFERAREYYRSGEFARSAVLLREAIALYDSAPLHYNLGRALQELGEWEEARGEYALFLEMEPETTERERLEARMQLLDARIAGSQTAQAETEPQPVEVAVPDPEPEPPARRARTGAWVTFGAGLGVVVGGLVLTLLSRSAADRARDAPDHENAFGPAMEARRYAIAGDVLFALGGAVAATSLLWALLGKDRNTDTGISVGLGRVALQTAF